MDCSQEPDILHAIAKMMGDIFSPAVHAISRWGDLDENPQGLLMKKDFLKSIGSFTHFIDGEIFDSY